MVFEVFQKSGCSHRWMLVASSHDGWVHCVVCGLRREFPHELYYCPRGHRLTAYIISHYRTRSGWKQLCQECAEFKPSEGKESRH